MTTKIVREHEGWYARTDDAGRFCLNDSPARGPVPTEIACEPIGFHCEAAPDITVERRTRTVKWADLTLLGVADFGPARGDRIKWTGDAYRFGVYSCDRGYGSSDIVIVETNGAGTFGYVLSGSCEGFDFWTWAATLPGPRLWDLCRTVTEAYDDGRANERGYQHRLLAQGRLKVNRRRPGVVRIETLPRKEPAPV